MTTPPPPSNDNNSTSYHNLSKDVLYKLSLQPPQSFVTSSKTDLPRIEKACIDAANKGKGRCIIELANVGSSQKKYCDYICKILSKGGLESGALDKSSCFDEYCDPNYHKLVVIWNKSM